MLQGTLSKIDQEKGFGFISYAEGPDVFFHRSTCQSEFPTLLVGAEMKFSLDDAADRPRASSVLLVQNGTGEASSTDRGGPRNRQPRDFSDRSPRDRRGSGRERSSFDSRQKPRFEDRENRPPPNCQFGHVTRIFWNDRAGMISAVTGGPEIRFEQRAVRGITFGKLEVGQYVEFAVSDRTEELTAFFVQPTERPMKQTPGMLSRHPRSRGKKPTWRK